MRSTLIAVVATALLSCAPPAVDTANDEAALREQLSAFWEAGNDRDLEAMMSHYADDAVVMAANAPTMTGTDAIRQYMLSLWETGTAEIVGTIEEVHVAGDFGMVRGSIDVRVTPADGSEPFSDNSNFVEIYRRQADGSWKSAWDIWNSTLPLPTS